MKTTQNEIQKSAPARGAYIVKEEHLQAGLVRTSELPRNDVKRK